jgi:hypothetical protein
LDGAGQEVAKDIPGDLRALGDRYAVFYTGYLRQFAGSTFTVHRVSG